MRVFLRLALILACASASASAVKAADNTTHFVLGNGMEVLVIEDHRAPVVVHMVWYRAGAADEPPGTSGIAHYLEHLLFKETENLANGEFSKVVAANGGRDNAFTSYDFTAYYQRVAADRLELMMQMEADRMVNLKITQEDILAEREVVIEERNQRVENDPGALFGEQANAALYLNHPYGKPIIGWKHEMETLTLADALAFYKRHYAPNNAILVVAGDVTPDEVKALAETYYGVIPANPELGPRRRPQEPPHTAARHLIFEDPRVAQPYVRRQYLAPERDSGAQREAAALMLGAQLLGGGQTSFMAQRLQHDSQRAVSSYAYYRGMSLDDTMMTMVVLPAPGISLAEIEQDLDETLQAFLDAPLDDDLLKRIKMKIKSRQIYARDDVQGLANRYGTALTTGLTIDDIREWPGIVQSITAEEIKDAMTRVLDPRKSVTGWLRAPATPEEVQQ